jgi:NAD(P)-dependent dehydrogenase (short-subunit alcohol dehydrogenase family)
VNAHPDRRSVIVTGASGLLGTALCRRLAPTWNVLGVYRHRLIELPTQDQRLINPLDPRRELPDNRHPIVACCADLFVDADVDRLVTTAMDRFGYIDGIVNAAAHSVWAPMLADDRLLESLLPHFFINAIVPAKLATLVAWRCWANGSATGDAAWSGVVVNVSSTAAQTLYEGRGQSGYAASKAALETLTRHMAAEFGKLNARVNAVAPNSFPARVRVEEVVEAICEQLDGSMSGEIRRIGG